MTARPPATARTFLGAELMFAGELADGPALAEQAAAEAEALDLYPLPGPGAVGLLAMARAYSGDLDGERRAHEARLASYARNGDLDRTADVLDILAEIALDDGDGDTARGVRRRGARPSPATACRRSCATRPSRWPGSALLRR